ncbi:unnamed protein product [Cuscuta campestris]|uniref:Uncharacterized protein n=1 Tax=Cuscuta campestris TaxID=132261 RepID=A0A484LTG0_9ASTE|nr:unnamed protein product [Cuscuta campestris]
MLTPRVGYSNKFGYPGRGVTDHLSVKVVDKVKIPVKLTAQNIDILGRLGDVGVNPRKIGGQGCHLLGERRVGRSGGPWLAARTRLSKRSFVGARVEGGFINLPMLCPFIFGPTSVLMLYSSRIAMTRRA